MIAESARDVPAWSSRSASPTSSIALSLEKLQSALQKSGIDRATNQPTADPERRATSFSRLVVFNERFENERFVEPRGGGPARRARKGHVDLRRGQHTKRGNPPNPPNPPVQGNRRRPHAALVAREATDGVGCAQVCTAISVPRKMRCRLAAAAWRWAPPPPAVCRPSCLWCSPRPGDA